MDYYCYFQNNKEFRILNKHSHTTLVNFNISHSLLTQFDLLCRHIGKTRTATLIEIIESFIIDRGGEHGDRQRTLAALEVELLKEIELDRILRQEDDPVSFSCDELYEDSRNDWLNDYDWHAD